MVEAKNGHILEHITISNLALYFSEVFSEDDLADGPFAEDGEALVEPEVCPVGHSDGVSEPTVQYLMDSHIDLLLVFGDDGGRGESHQRVFHASEREAGRQNQNSVVPPFVLPERLLSHIKVLG